MRDRALSGDPPPQRLIDRPPDPATQGPAGGEWTPEGQAATLLSRIAEPTARAAASPLARALDRRRARRLHLQHQAAIGLTAVAAAGAGIALAVFAPRLRLEPAPGHAADAQSLAASPLSETPPAAAAAPASRPLEATAAVGAAGPPAKQPTAGVRRRALAKLLPAAPHDTRHVAANSTAGAGVPGPAPSPPPSAAPDPLALEAQLLSEAQRQLYRQRDPPGSLATLAVYRAQFPTGALRLQAGITAVDAQLALGRSAEALAVLESLPAAEVAQSARHAQLEVLWAELLQKNGQCQGALPRFEALVDTLQEAPLAARALYGRALCRLNVGQTAAGKGDLKVYLARFPNEPEALEVRRLLEAR